MVACSAACASSRGARIDGPVLVWRAPCRDGATVARSACRPRRCPALDTAAACVSCYPFGDGRNSSCKRFGKVLARTRAAGRDRVGVGGCIGATARGQVRLSMRRTLRLLRRYRCRNRHPRALIGGRRRIRRVSVRGAYLRAYRETRLDLDRCTPSAWRVGCRDRVAHWRAYPSAMTLGPNTRHQQSPRTIGVISPTMCG